MTATSAFRDAAFVSSFAKTGGGKTLDQIAAFPNGLVFSLSRELKTAISVLGYHPHGLVEVKTLYDVDAAVNNLLTLRSQKNQNALTYNAVVIDDLTVIAYQTEQALREGITVKGTRLKPKGWDLWTEQRNESLALAFYIAERCKQAGLHLAVNGHMRVARTNAAGKILRGGIDLPTDLAESFTAGCDMAAMIVDEPERLWHPTMFSVKNHDGAWATKNRLGLPDRVPANTGEILRSSGYVLPRAPGHEVYETYVEQLAEYLGRAFAAGAPMTRDNLRSVLPGAIPQLSALVKDPRHLQWIVRDAVDRTWLRREKMRGMYAEMGMANG